jgi:uridine kinase
MKVIAIGGEPGAGKTTLMKKLIASLGVEPKYDAVKLVPYLQKDNVYVLGKYEEGEVFAGTDRMSMAVQPEAIKFLATLPENSVVLYEGDRLFTASFLEDCLDKYDLKIVYLSTTKDVRKERYAERGSNQNETWLAGRESKVANILGNLILTWSIFKYKNNSLVDQGIIYNEIMRMIDGKN